MVIVSSKNSSNIGFISRSLSHEELSQLRDQLHDPLLPTKKILSKLKDGDETIRNILYNKIHQENSVLMRSYSILRGHTSSHHLHLLATEYSFDQKNLIIFLQRDLEEVSVCRLVRKLFEIFKIKIKVKIVESGEALCGSAEQYLKLSQLNVTMEDLLPSPPPSVLASSSSHTGASSAYGTSGLASYHPRLTNTSRTPPIPNDRSQYYPGLARSGSGSSYSTHNASTSGHVQPMNSSSNSDLLRYGPPCVRTRAPGVTSGIRDSGIGQSHGTIGSHAPPSLQGNKPMLLGPLMLLSPTSVTTSPTSSTPTTFFSHPQPSPLAADSHRQYHGGGYGAGGSSGAHHGGSGNTHHFYAPPAVPPPAPPHSLSQSPLQTPHYEYECDYHWNTPMGGYGNHTYYPPAPNPAGSATLSGLKSSSLDPYDHGINRSFSSGSHAFNSSSSSFSSSSSP
jgi:hypothetical protein